MRKQLALLRSSRLGGGRRPEGPPPRPAGAAGADTQCRVKCKHGKEFLRRKSDLVRASQAPGLAEGCYLAGTSEVTGSPTCDMVAVQRYTGHELNDSTTSKRP